MLLTQNLTVAFIFYFTVGKRGHVMSHEKSSEILPQSGNGSTRTKLLGRLEDAAGQLRKAVSNLLTLPRLRKNQT